MAKLDPDKALFALTLAWTGARVSEVLALTPAAFQIEDGLVAFRTLKR
jgi:integrase